MAAGQDRDHCTCRDRPLQDPIAQGPTRVTRHDHIVSPELELRDVAIDERHAPLEARPGTRQRRMEGAARWRLRWVDHDGFGRRVVEQDHQVRQQAGSTGSINDSPAPAESPDSPRDFPCFVQLLARKATRVTEGPADAIEQGVARKTIQVMHREPVARSGCECHTQEYPLHAFATFAGRRGPPAKGAQVVTRHYRRLSNVTLVGGVMLALAAGAGTAQAPAQSAPGSIPVRPSPQIAGVVAGGTQPQVIATGLKGADDPVWLPGVGLVFAEPNGNRIVRLSDGDTLVTLVDGLHAPLGMTVARDGRLVSLQSEAGFTSVRVVWPAGKEAVIADRYQGLPFSRPNGIVSDRNGGVYFSDPGLAPPQEAELRKTQKRLPPAVYYVPRGGEPVQVADGIARPNGVHLSRDEKTLYVNDTNGIQSFAFDVQSDGRLRNRRVFATYTGRTPPLGGGDGIASGADDLVIDGDGRVYSITAAGIEVFTESGQPLGIIPVTCSPAGARCQALAFGGQDKRTLYVAGNGTLLRLRMVAQGFMGRAK